MTDSRAFYLELARMTRDEVAEHASHALLVVPTAATEQHGPHLPLGTDAMIGETLARKALSEADLAKPAVLAPLLPYGSSHHHLIYSALSLSTHSYLNTVTDLLESAIVSGFRRIFVLNAHGGNAECVRLATRDTGLAREVVIGSCSYWDVAREAVERAGLGHLGPVPGHAGQFETSLMMAIAPDLVQSERFPRAPHRGPIQDDVASGSVVQAHGDWSRTQGFTDLPLEPSHDVGRRLLEILSARTAATLEEFERVAGRALEDSASTTLAATPSEQGGPRGPLGNNRLNKNERSGEQ